MEKAIEDLSHDELYAWRRNSNTDLLSPKLKERLEQYFTIHRLYIDSTPRHQIAKILKDNYNLTQKEFDYIFPLAIRYFNSEKKITEDDFMYLQYEKFNKVIKAFWMSGDLKGYMEAVEKQTKACRPKTISDTINPDDIKQNIFILTSNPEDFGYDRPDQKAIMKKILSFKKTHDITDSEVKKIAEDAGIYDVEFESNLDNE